MKTFADFFEKYTDIKKLPTSITKSNIINAKIDAGERSMEIDAECHELIERKDIFNAEAMIKSSVLNLSKCFFMPHYDSTLFDIEYYPQLVLELKRRNATLNGTLNDSTAELKNKDLMIELRHGGKDFLIKQKFDKNLSELIRSEFGLNFNVKLGGITAIDSESDAYSYACCFSDPYIWIVQLCRTCRGQRYSYECCR